MDNGENQYRVQRLELNTRKTGDYDGDTSSNTRILPPYSQPVSDNNIPQINNNVKLPIVSNNDMQNKVI